MIEGTCHKAAHAYFVRTTPRQSLILFLATGFVLAVVSFGYLAALPSDSSDPFLGRYSAARVILMAGPFLLAAACGGFLLWALGYRPWSEKVGRVLVAGERGLRRFVAAGIGIAATEGIEWKGSGCSSFHRRNALGSAGTTLSASMQTRSSAICIDDVSKSGWTSCREGAASSRHTPPREMSRDCAGSPSRDRVIEIPGLQGTQPGE